MPKNLALKSTLQFLEVPFCVVSEELAIAHLLIDETLSDGAKLPAYFQILDNHTYRFFDDGQVMLHWLGHGLDFNEARLAKLKNAALRYGCSLSDAGTIEVLSKQDDIKVQFSKFLACLRYLRKVPWRLIARLP